jgi:hypothetical protein
MKRATVIIVLAASATGLVLALYDIQRSPVETSPIVPARRTSSTLPVHQTSLSPPLVSQTPASFPEIVNRPLFWPSRRPIAPPQPPSRPIETASPAIEPVASGLRLAGIINDGDVRRRALLVWPGQPAGQWLHEGADMAGWRLLKIERFGVQVSTGSRIERLDLH